MVSGHSPALRPFGPRAWAWPVIMIGYKNFVHA